MLPAAKMKNKQHTQETRSTQLVYVTIGKSSLRGGIHSIEDYHITMRQGKFCSEHTVLAETGVLVGPLNSTRPVVSRKRKTASNSS